MKKIALLLGSSLLLTGCQAAKTGPYNLRHDSISYNRAVQNSTDSQLLLNIVRLRYRDTPTFLQVGVISTAYESTLGVSSEFDFTQITRSTSNVAITPRVNLERKEKPTTTFAPVRGESFVKEFLSPVSLQAMVLLNSSGWKIDRIMRCCVQRLNGVNNAPSASGPTPKYAPDYDKFLELSSLFSELEKEDVIDIIMEKNPDSGQIEVFLYIEEDLADPEIVQRIWELLEVDSGLYKIKLVAYHGKRHRSNEIIVDMRSPLSLLYFLSQSVEVPPEDQMMGKVTLTVDDEGYLFNWDEVLGGIMKIHSGTPCNSIASSMVHYRGTYFYIDDSDLESKSTFSLLSQLLALQIKAPELPAIALTIPLN
jgi:hypothetical protein